MNFIQCIIITAIFVLWFVLFYIVGCLMEAVERLIKSRRKHKSRAKVSTKTVAKGE